MDSTPAVLVLADEMLVSPTIEVTTMQNQTEHASSDSQFNFAENNVAAFIVVDDNIPRPPDPQPPVSSQTNSGDELFNFGSPMRRHVVQRRIQRAQRRTEARIQARRSRVDLSDFLYLPSAQRFQASPPRSPSPPLIPPSPPSPPSKDVNFSYEINRINSFDTFPGFLLKSLNLTATMMAKAGLYYFGSSDIVKCYDCQLTFKDFDVGENPLIKHAKAAGESCIFLSCNFFANDISVAAGIERIEKLEKNKNKNKRKRKLKVDSDVDVQCEKCDYFLCKICYERPVSKFSIRCGHTFCADCDTRNLECPFCKKFVHSKPVYVHQLKQTDEIENLYFS